MHFHVAQNRLNLFNSSVAFQMISSTGDNADISGNIALAIVNPVNGRRISDFMSVLTALTDLGDQRDAQNRAVSRYNNVFWPNRTLNTFLDSVNPGCIEQFC